MPHLGGKAYALRSAIVTAVGYLIQNAYSDEPGEEADAQGKLKLIIHCDFLQHSPALLNTA